MANIDTQNICTNVFIIYFRSYIWHMEIKIVNDGKEKSQSWEAHAKIELPSADVHISGYGWDEQEAREELRKALSNTTTAFMKGLADIRAQLE